MAALLVSVRDAAEVAAALDGGAALIDIKEPLAGALGRAPDAAREAILAEVAGRVPVSVALGELRDEGADSNLSGVTFAKYGLAGCAEFDWGALAGLTTLTGGCQLVLAAYADWRRAGAPPPSEVFRYAARNHMAAVLLDTWAKDGSTLLDWLSVADVIDLCEVARAGGARVALAGSLGGRQILALAPARPDWFAVRGAACTKGERTAAIDADRVRELAAITRAG